MTDEEAFDMIGQAIRVVNETMWKLDELECLTPDLYHAMLHGIQDYSYYMCGINEEAGIKFIEDLTAENKPRLEARETRLAKEGIGEIEQFLASLDEN